VADDGGQCFGIALALRRRFFEERERGIAKQTFGFDLAGYGTYSGMLRDVAGWG
jgi:hypothetical protein